MITTTNYNQPTQNFKAQVKLGQNSPKIKQYLKGIGINSNRAMIGGLTTTAGAGAVSLARPDLISNPDFAKVGLVGGIAAVLGSMIPMVRTRKTDVAQNDTDMIAKAQAEAEAKVKAEQKAQAKAEKIEARKAACSTRWEKAVTPFKNRCRKHYNCCTRGLLCIVGTTSVALDIATAASCTDLGWAIPAILTGFTVYEGIMYKLGKKYYYEDRHYRW